MRILTISLLSFLPLAALAQGFKEQNGEFLWQRNGREIRFQGGRWSVGLVDGKQLRFHPFLWHDAYLYETLQGGKVAEGPVLTPEGKLVMSGVFSAREGSAPLQYWLTVTPTPEGVVARFEFEKSAPLKLNNGVWLHLFADRQTFDGTERLWADPAGAGTLGAPSLGAARRLLVELDESASLCMSAGSFREVNAEGNKDAYAMRMNLAPGDFPVGKRTSAELTIGFAQMPEHFPGEITPSAQPLAIRKVTASGTTVAQYGKVELTVELGATYSNPFDPDEVALNAEFTAPSGKRLVVPGFFMIEHQRQVNDKHEVMIPQGNGWWKVRFTPTELGTYSYLLRLKDGSGEISGGKGALRCVAGKSKGFIRTSRADPHYLAFDDGSGYFAIGHNLPGYHTSNQLADEAMRKFAAAGENFNRWWLYSYQLGLEWTPKLGWYKQDAAARLDQALEWGEELGIYYMLCMDTHQDFRERGWEHNPYSVKNGGPCANAGEFFTNPQAKDYYRKRLRYLVARYGYSRSVLCWEFGNEMEGWADSPDAIKLPWHREMSDHLRSLDPFGHLITTSFWSHTGPPEYWQLPNIDIVQTHLYMNNDMNTAEKVRELSLKQWREFAKPHIFGEFGINSRGGFEKNDPKGWGIHNALWAGLTSFCAGGPMPWWHENYIDPLDLYFHFTALANFTVDLPLGTAKWDLLDPRVEYQDKDRAPETRDATVIPMARWGKAADTEFTLQDDGNLAEGKRPQQLLQGLGHADLKTPVSFHVTYPQPGQFIMHIGRVSNSGLVRVWVDGQLVKEIDLPCGEGLGASSLWREQWKLWECAYNRAYSVDIPAGPHQIKVENFGKDWVSVDRYVFTGCQLRRTPNVLAGGMRTRNLAIVWLQNRDSDWFNHLAEKVPPVDPTVLTLTGLQDGAWTLETWETWQGTRQANESVKVKNGQLQLRLPALATDVAFKLRRVGR